MQHILPPSPKPESEVISDAIAHKLLREGLKLRNDLPIEKAVQVALVEEGYRHYYANVMLGLKRGSKGGRVDRSAMRMFEKALLRVGHIAEPVRRMLEELTVDSVEQLRSMVDAYRLGERATDEDRAELALQTLEQYVKNHPDAADNVSARVKAMVGKEA